MRKSAIFAVICGLIFAGCGKSSNSSTPTATGGQVSAYETQPADKFKRGDLTFTVLDVAAANRAAQATPTNLIFMVDGRVLDVQSITAMPEVVCFLTDPTDEEGLTPFTKDQSFNLDTASLVTEGKTTVSVMLFQEVKLGLGCMRSDSKPSTLADVRRATKGILNIIVNAR